MRPRGAVTPHLDALTYAFFMCFRQVSLKRRLSETQIVGPTPILRRVGHNIKYENSERPELIIFKGNRSVEKNHKIASFSDN